MGFSLEGRNRRGRGRRPQADINVTPMVDVMLVLLIIFMVAAPMMTSGINVDLPKTAAKPVNADTKPITVTVREDGSVYLGDNVVGDQHINYGRVMEVMGRVTAGGFTHVALLAQMPDTTSNPSSKAP